MYKGVFVRSDTLLPICIRVSEHCLAGAPQGVFLSPAETPSVDDKQNFKKSSS